MWPIGSAAGSNRNGGAALRCAAGRDPVHARAGACSRTRCSLRCPPASWRRARYVVGIKRGARVRVLPHSAGVTVTGTVPGVRPYLAHTALVLAPPLTLADIEATRGIGRMGVGAKP
jgi:hypothetical protein